MVEDRLCERVVCERVACERVVYERVVCDNIVCVCVWQSCVWRSCMSTLATQKHHDYCQLPRLPRKIPAFFSSLVYLSLPSPPCLPLVSPSMITAFATLVALYQNSLCDCLSPYMITAFAALATQAAWPPLPWTQADQSMRRLPETL